MTKKKSVLESPSTFEHAPKHGSDPTKPGAKAEACESVLSGPECISGMESSTGKGKETEHFGKPHGSALDSPESMVEGAEAALRKRAGSKG